MNRIIKRAFTLIELLVVIAIIGILSGLIVVGLSGMTQKANIAKSQIFANSLRNSLMLNIVSEYRLDGDVTDSWANNDGTVHGAPVFTSSNCISGQCLIFGGSDYVSVGDKDELSFTNNIFTFSFWMKTSVGSGFSVLGKRGGPWEYSIYNKTGNTVFMTWLSDGSAATCSNSTSTETDVWNYFVWTSDGIKSYLYKNSAQSGTACTRGASSLSNTTASFEFGRGGDGVGLLYMNGMLDELRIFNSFMPTSQVKEQYYAGLNNLLSSNQINVVEYRERINLIADNE